MKCLKIREEIFGATLFFSDTGKRTYITKDELNQIMQHNKFPKDLNYANKYKIDFYPLGNIYSIQKFSFANIAYIELTRSCNLHCKHCLNNSGQKLENELSYEEWIKLISDLNDSGIQEIRFTGGEPLLYDKILDLISICTKKGIYVSLGTNATLITKEMTEKLKKSGLKKAIVSIDGTVNVHNEIRGKKAYETAMRGLENLIENGIDFKINSVIMKKNMNDIINFAKSTYEKKYPLFIRRFIESGRGKNLTSNTLDDIDYKYVNKELGDIIDKTNLIRGHYLNLTDDTNDSRIKIPFELRYSCKVGQRALVILPNGDIQYCGFLSAQGFPALGNVLNITNWREFWVSLDNDKKLFTLTKRLDEYNKIKNIKNTNCLAYAMSSYKKQVILFVSKYNLFKEQAKKIQNENIVKTFIIVIEDFCKSKNVLTLNPHDVVYFICCNSNLINSAINLINGGHIINKDYLINDYKKKEIQIKLNENNINTPIIYDKQDSLKFPVFCKENIHQGISFKTYNSITLNRFFEKFNINNFYFEENINGIDELKIYYINGFVYSKNTNITISSSLIDLCNKISKILNNIEIYSADFIKCDDEYYIIDLNSSAGFYQSDIARYQLLNYMVNL